MPSLKQLDDLTIERGVPLPGRVAASQKTKYPFAAMDVGDSFRISEAAMRNARNSAYLYAKRHGQRFSCRRVSDTAFRVWRIE